MSSMTAQEIRQSYLKFFEERGHKVVPRALLVPEGDPTTLFTGSGMQPMIPYLLGQPHPAGQRIVDSQTCLRSQDIDEIGDNRHTTFFEMLGNWSLGDYFKTQQIEWMWEFLTDVVELDPAKLYITCFIGASQYDIPRDTEAAETWQKLFDVRGLSSGTADIGSEEQGYARGIKDGERIFYYDGSKNWWSRNGKPETTPVGDPCGPDSEMFYDFGTPHNPDYGEFCHPNCDCGRFMEIGNNVFMAYRKEAEGKFVPLEKPNIDHGSGLERIAAAAMGDPDVFKISLMWPIIEKLQEISGKSYDSHTESMRVIADHLRAATFLAVDGIVPSNKEQGYVMRRLIRRAIRFAFDLGVEQNFLEQIVPVIADLYKDDFPEVAANREKVIQILIKEEKAFRQTLRKGLKELERLSVEPKAITITWASNGEMYEKLPLAEQIILGKELRPGATIKEGQPMLTGADIFKLQDTYGFPIELSIEEAATLNIPVTVDWKDRYDELRREQQYRSQTATKGTFKGGLGGHTLQHKKYHTATHLLQAALRQLFGPELRQHGSNITEERLRFDFNLDHKMTAAEIKQAEDLVNGWINEDLPVKFTEYPTQEAHDMGAVGPFGERYGQTVKVYQMGPDDHIVSLEICGGPHVDHTGQLAEDNKTFKITKEESSSAGIRRIKAILQ
ncbi:MAG: alanine--tRNA ligase-related protein [Candidatus Saccharimonadales bacterium]